MLPARRLILFSAAAFAALAAVLAVVLPAGIASSASAAAAETRVWAFSLAAPVHARAEGVVSADQRLGDPASCPFCAPGACVAPEAGGGGQALLASIGQDGKTAGVLNVDGELTPLVSGRSSLGNYAASGHVEGQAALIMRETGVSKAELLIDNPNGICGYCNSQLPTLLPEGAELTVRPPLGTVPPSSRWFNGRTFIGNANDPKPWP